jgi:H+/gluconate symporter-like permease
MRDEAPSSDEAVPTTPPSFGQALSIIGLPLVLILTGTVSDVVLEPGTALQSGLQFVGHPFTALTAAVVLAFYVLGVRSGYPMQQVQQIATKALEPVGLIILVTGAGGVLGEVLVETGVGEVLAEAMAASNLPVVLLAFLIALVVRVSQGSATVSMVTAAGLVAPVLDAGTYSPPLVGLITIAIASGATVLSHVNDSGFWLVSRFLGMDESETLRSWTVMETLVGLVGLIVVLGLSLLIG